MKGCSCRDCHEPVYTADGGWTLCEDCLWSGCTPHPTRPSPYEDYSCQRTTQEA